MTECKRLRDQQAVGPTCPCPETACVLDIVTEARALSVDIGSKRATMATVHVDDRTDDLTRAVGLLAEAFTILIADSFQVTRSLDRIESLLQDGVCRAGEYY